MNTPNNPQAFPGSTREAVAGMTLRDYFAAATLTSMSIAPDYSKGLCDNFMVERAYRIADLMLVQREKGQQ